MVELALCCVLVLVWYNSTEWQKQVNKHKDDK